MSNLINLPDFIFIGKDLSNTSKIKKLTLLIKAVFLIFVFNKTKNKYFCFIINLIFRNAKIQFDGLHYYKKIEGKNFYYPNKRIERIIIDHKEFLNRLFQTYCLENISFDKNDKVIDCGANVGELYLKFKVNKLDINYIAFEPDINAFNCLKKNVPKEVDLYNKALGSHKSTMKLYQDTEGANTSLVDFGSSNYSEIEVIDLDSLELKNVKLFKIDAEGYEHSVLQGAKNTLKTTKYVSVDYGNEKGIEEESTMVEVLNFLYENNFELIADSRYRKVGLFKNIAI